MGVRCEVWRCASRCAHKGCGCEVWRDALLETSEDDPQVRVAEFPTVPSGPATKFAVCDGVAQFVNTYAFVHMVTGELYAILAWLPV